METFAEHDSGLWVPNDRTADVVREGEGADRVIVDNRTDLPDGAIFQAVETYFEESVASFGWGGGTSYQSYASEGSMLARTKFRLPQNVIEEIKLARDLAERDDDVGSALDSLVLSAYADGYANLHPDEQIQATFDEFTEDIGLHNVLQELAREWLLTGQVNTVSIFTPGNYDIRPNGVTRVLNRRIAAPLIGVLPAEHIRVVGNDMFKTARLAYVPEGKLAEWLQSYFGATAAKKALMAKEDPVSAALFVSKITVTHAMEDEFITMGMDLYELNPRMVARTTMAKGGWKYARPPLTRNFALLEAKRLLNIMDFSLLQGGTNYIVIAKKGSDQRPATQDEVTNLREVVKRASTSGVLIGDHRVSLEVVTPDLTSLLNAEKRQMIGRKLSMALLRVPEFGSDDTGQSVETFTELMGRVISADRIEIRNHIHRHIWPQVMTRNESTFGRAKRPTLWFPKLILQGLQFWTEYLLKMYDRGDLPRKWMIEFGGFNFDAAVAEKERQNEAGHDETFIPPPVPFSSPDQGPQDNGPGRPRGGSPDNGRPGATPRSRDPHARPTKVIRRTRGENVRAYWSDEHNSVIRIGELTDAILSSYPDVSLGRMTALEQRAAEATEPTNEGTLAVVPVNLEYETDDHRAVRLEEGLSMLVGKRKGDRALVARALCFREPQFNLTQAEDMAIRWGFSVALAGNDQPEPEEVAAAAAAAAAPGLTLIVNGDGQMTEKIVERDPETGAITAIRERAIETEPEAE